MKSCHQVGMMMVLVMFACPIVLRQDNSQRQVVTNQKIQPIRIWVLLQSGELYTGSPVKIDNDSVEGLVKVDNNSVDLKGGEPSQSISIYKVNHIRFGDATTNARGELEIPDIVDPHISQRQVVTNQEAKPIRIWVFLQSGEIHTGSLVKIDNDSVDVREGEASRSIPIYKVNHIRFGDAKPDARGELQIPDIVEPHIDYSPDVPPMSADLRPEIIYREKAQYTVEAQQNGVGGSVILNMVFNADGTISHIRVVRGLPHGLTEKAIEAAKKMKFKPAMKDGRPVSVRGNLEYTFNLYENLPPPKLLSPRANEVLSSGQDKTTLQWEPVLGAVKYRVMIEKESQRAGEWLFENEVEVTETTYTFSYSDSRVRRWSVQGVDSSGLRGRPARWRIFRHRK